MKIQLPSSTTYRPVQNTTDEENSLPARRSTTPENNQPRQNETRQESVKRSDRKQTYQTYTQQLPTRDGGLSPVRRLHIRGEDPQPNIEEAFPQQTKAGKPVAIKKIETQLSSNTPYPDRQNLTCNNDLKEPIPLTTEARFEYLEIDTTEILLPVEIRAKLIQTFPRPDQHTVAPPRVVKLSTNELNWQNPDQINGLPQTTVIRTSLNQTQKSVTPYPDYEEEAGCANSQIEDNRHQIIPIGNIHNSTKTSLLM